MLCAILMVLLILVSHDRDFGWITTKVLSLETSVKEHFEDIAWFLKYTKKWKV